MPSKRGQTYELRLHPRTYGKNPVPGERVRHQITERFGTIVRGSSQLHYVHVRFDGQKFSTPAHPEELDYLGPPTPENTSTPATAKTPPERSLAERLDASAQRVAENTSTQTKEEQLARLIARIDRIAPPACDPASWVSLEVISMELIRDFERLDGASYRKLPNNGGVYTLRLAGISSSCTSTKFALLRNWQKTATRRLEKMKGAVA